MFRLKQRILCYFCSHVVACNDLATRCTLLQGLQHVSNGAKAITLLPLLEESLQSIDETHAHRDAEFTRLLLEVFDSSLAPAFNEDLNSTWTLFSKGLEKCLQVNQVEMLRIMFKQLSKEIFPGLTASKQVDVCVLLIGAGVKTSNSVRTDDCLLMV